MVVSSKELDGMIPASRKIISFLIWNVWIIGLAMAQSPQIRSKVLSNALSVLLATTSSLIYLPISKDLGYPFQIDLSVLFSVYPLQDQSEDRRKNAIDAVIEFIKTASKTLLSPRHDYYSKRKLYSP